LGIPCPAHVLKVDFQINGGDVAVSAEEVVQNVSSRDVGKADHVVIKNVQIHRFKNTDDLFFQSLLHEGVCVISVDVLLPNVAGSANLVGCAVRVGWGQPGGLWAYPKCWTSIRCWGNHGVGCILDDESQVSQSASTQVGVNCPGVCLKGLPDGVDCLIVRFALNCWKYRVREASNDVFESCVLHIAVLGGPECLCALLSWKRVWTGVPKRRKCLLRAVALGINVLVMTNELHGD
jgi:hypothetical protein